MSISLAANGYTFEFDGAPLAQMMTSAAAGEISDDTLRTHMLAHLWPIVEKWRLDSE